MCGKMKLLVIFGKPWFWLCHVCGCLRATVTMTIIISLAGTVANLKYMRSKL
uniref:Uncharacterized protein n=1 Tax=Anguilla anguilla TaxID=7936 RepID=A0A0E9UNT4_ANGAN